MNRILSEHPVSQSTHVVHVGAVLEHSPEDEPGVGVSSVTPVG